jgi:hypothetical protein
MSPIKPGYMTTEFWFSVATSLWAMLNSALTPGQTAAVTGISAGVYTIARTLHKMNLLGGTAGQVIDEIDAAKNPSAAP